MITRVQQSDVFASLENLNFTNAFLDSIPQGILVFDHQFQIKYWNKHMEEISGIWQSKAINQAFFSLFPSAKERLLPFFIKTLSGQHDTVNASLKIHKDSFHQYYSIQFMPLNIQNRKISFGIALLKILTPQDFSEQAKLDSDLRFRVMADCAPVMLWLADTSSECYFFNQGWYNFTGKKWDQERGVGWAKGIHAGDFQKTMDHYIESFNARVGFSMEYRLRRHDGEYRWVLDNGTPLYDSNGLFNGYIGSCIDITELKENEKHLGELLKRMSRANEELKQFNHILYHDLQEPIRNIANYAQLIKMDSEQINEPMITYLKHMSNAASRAQKIIASMLEYTKISLNSEQLEKVDLNEIIRKCLQSFPAENQPKTVKFHKLPIIQGHSFLIYQLFHNLMHNSIKYKSKSPLAIEIIASDKGRSWLISFSDNGIGISPQFTEQVFQPFKQLAAHDPMKGTGVGLGLTICKKIIDTYQGEIWCQSTLNQGTTFYMSMPK